MLGHILKITLSFSALFLFITLFWQCSIADALPVLVTDDNMGKSIDDVSHLFTNNIHTGTYNKNLRAAKRMKAALDNRLKRFRMLDQDEFQEMLKSLSQQTTEDQSKASNGMDAIGGMQLANYWSSA
ncbi:hypothetical protein I4U23_018486 [Adineta vaga]|nr:hypothetical protein I4U23_018486 [Adineta vaga]